MKSPVRRNGAAWAVLAISLAATFWVFLASRESLRLKAVQRLTGKAEHVRGLIERRLHDYEQLLIGSKGLYAASKQVDEAEWHRYVASHELAVNYPGILSLAYVQRVPASGKEAYLAAMRAKYPSFSITPAGDRKEYFPGTFADMANGAAPILGFDGYADSTRRAAMDKAWETGQPALTAGLTLRVDSALGGKSSFVVYVPVYRNGVSIRSAGDRGAALQGFISAGFRMRDLMAGLPTAMATDVGFRVYDGRDTDAADLMYAAGSESGRGGFSVILDIPLSGRQWTLETFEGPGFISRWERLGPFGILLSGLFISALLSGLTWSLVNTRRRADALAEAMTAELRARSEEFRELAHRADEATRAKSEFLANMSHELRTPLNSVIGFANILLKNKAGNLREQDVSFLGRIQENGKHLLALINSVLDLTKIEAGRMDLDWSDVDILTLARETAGHLEQQVRDRGLELRLDLPAECGPIRADAVKLKQVIINLVGNALKFTEKGHVTLRLRAEGGIPVVLEVADSGIGIPPDRLEAIFEAFRQSDNSISRRFGGSGLGLTISRSLIRLMGFELGVSSEVGKGSVFSILLGRTVGPGNAGARREPSKEETAARDRAAGSLSRCALVIDDENDSRVLIRSHLEDLGYRVVEAGSGDEGLRLARRLHPDLITLDLMMPSMEGREVAREIKADPALWNIPVFVISIVAREVQGDIPGTVALVEKPVTRDALLSALGKLREA